MTSDYTVPAKNQKCSLESASDFHSITPLSALLDDFALNAMVHLMHIYTPEALISDEKELDKWCTNVAQASYCMAATMMDARTAFHDILLEGGKEEETDAS
jgi:hypothetical protein